MWLKLTQQSSGSGVLLNSDRMHHISTAESSKGPTYIYYKNDDDDCYFVVMESIDQIQRCLQVIDVQDFCKQHPTEGMEQ